ncbi:MAG TPA: metallophosphoesterase [Nitrospira sp.]|jgi:Icc-related predicted phosphoesterase|nr:metallophosphoesterase [Nitrospira sp.]
MEAITVRDSGSVRVAAIGDLHCPRTSPQELRELFHDLGSEADVLLLCGDLTDYGKPDEARVLVEQLSQLRPMPVVAVLGNHEFECGKQDEITRILSDAGVIVLDGTAVEILGIGFAGVKGFCGGFGSRALQPWGEAALKQFARESVEETVKLESALAKLRTPSKVVLMHYAPIVETVRGEPPEIFAFLGSSRLEEPINRYEVTALFHGHAHNGSPEGRTLAGTPVYNVALPLMYKQFRDRRALRFVEIPSVAAPVAS